MCACLINAIYRPRSYTKNYDDKRMCVMEGRKKIIIWKRYDRGSIERNGLLITI